MSPLPPYHQQSRDIFARNADRPFIIELPIGRILTYRDTLALADHARALLLANGVARGDRVALVMVNSAEFAAFLFACLFLGAVLVPVNPSLHPQEVNFILTHSGAKVVVFSLCTRPLVLACMASAKVRQICLLLEQEKAQHPGEAEWPTLRQLDATPGAADPGVEGLSADDPLTIAFTSGTTSTPKGVTHRVASLFGNAMAFNAFMGFGAHSRFMNVWPMAYSSGYFNNLLSAFVAEGSLVMARTFEARTVLEFWKPVREHKVNTIWLSPSMMTALIRVDRDPSGPECCRAQAVTFCAGTAPLPLKVIRDFEQKYHTEVFESYGLSELLLVAGNSRRHARKPGSVGRLLPGVDIRFLDEQGSELAAGQEGEIVIRSPWIMRGYLNYDTGQADVLPAGAEFSTGDVGRVDGDGDLFITGRKKDLIIRGGLNISARVVEEALLLHDAVDQVAVVGMPHEYYGEEVVAVIKMKAGHRYEDERISLLEGLRQKLNAASVPTRMVAVDEFPVSSTGKIQKNVVRTRLREGMAGNPALGQV